MYLSPGLSGLCMAIFTALWGFTIIYGSYSRHSQRVVQVSAGQNSHSRERVGRGVLDAEGGAVLVLSRRLDAHVGCECG